MAAAVAAADTTAVSQLSRRSARARLQTLDSEAAAGADDSSVVLDIDLSADLAADTAESPSVASQSGRHPMLEQTLDEAPRHSTSADTADSSDSAADDTLSFDTREVVESSDYMPTPVTQRQSSRGLFGWIRRVVKAVGRLFKS